jgi:transcriptional regulator with XRE-family HTH domain
VEALGALLRRAREATRLSIKDFARALDYSPSYLSDVENGRRGVTRQLCDQLSPALGLDRVELYARAGHLSDEVLDYLGRQPSALRVLELLAELDADASLVSATCQEARRLSAAGAEARASTPPSALHACIGVVNGAPADAVQDCEALYDEEP